jgi:hypothetical protein
MRDGFDMLARVTPRAGSRRAILPLVASVVACVLLLAGCAFLAKQRATEQRTTQGPTAQQMFDLRLLNESGREPTFEERRRWDEQLEQQISAYLREHPEKANALDVSTFKFLRQSAVGMDKDQVLILLGPPLAVSADQAHMEQLSRRYWPLIQGNATEVWVYPVGWNLYFAGQRLIDITQYVAPPK